MRRARGQEPHPQRDRGLRASQVGHPRKRIYPGGQVDRQDHEKHASYAFVADDPADVAGHAGADRASAHHRHGPAGPHGELGRLFHGRVPDRRRDRVFDLVCAGEVLAGARGEVEHLLVFGMFHPGRWRIPMVAPHEGHKLGVAPERALRLAVAAGGHNVHPQRHLSCGLVYIGARDRLAHVARESDKLRQADGYLCAGHVCSHQRGGPGGVEANANACLLQHPDVLSRRLPSWVHHVGLHLGH
mmetsp:Transcript_90893/g.278242  ORF Transcript_90893/g.278242 Transcript_90893/m.278242 type:complete len:244 (-) Transcript_90893:318-1049(-)